MSSKIKNLSSAEKEIESKRNYVQLRNDGNSNLFAAKSTGLNETTAKRLWLRYKEVGEQAFTPKTPGRKEGEHRILSPNQEDKLKKLILKHTPDQLNLGFHLWSKKAVQKLISIKFKLELSSHTVSNYLERWGVITPKLKINKLKNNPRFESWFITDYSKLKVKAKEKYIEIHWCIEEILIKPREQRDKGHIYMIASMSNRDMFRFLLYEGEIDITIFKEFVKNLLRECERNLYLIFPSHSKFTNYNLNVKKRAMRTVKAKLFYIEDDL